MIVKVDENNIYEAALIHSKAWRDSHKDFCYPEFIAQHTVEHQEQYLRNEIFGGKELYMLIEDIPIGIVSIQGSLIENLYIKPSEQLRGYGTSLLKFAIKKCIGEPTLWILDNNEKAYNLYTKYGFYKTGNMNKLSESISELEMKQKL
jgi:GNAT superfamily N-acetyltransferase